MTPAHCLVDPQRLRGQRVLLRAWTAQDYSAFAALNADTQVMEHFPATLSRAQSDAMAQRIQALIAEQGWGFWAVQRIDAGGSASEFMGFVGLHRPDPILPFGPGVEIGWRLGRRFWGQGLAREAAALALGAGFEALDLPEIVAFTAHSNLRSQALMQRLHMQRDTAADFHHPALPQDHPLALHHLYRLTRQQWQAQAAAQPPAC